MRVDFGSGERLGSIIDCLKSGQSVLAHTDARSLLAKLGASRCSIKLAMLDPPYNRRTKFHHYGDSSRRDLWLDELSEYCSHLHSLLAEDGSLWMHIDDAEMPSAKNMLDDIFGRANFVATIVWQKNVSRDNRMAISTTHEYILAYAKNKSLWLQTRSKLPSTDLQKSRYKNPDNDPRGPWTSGDLTAKAGPGRRAAQFYDLSTPSGKVVRPATGTCWRFTQERLRELVEDNRIDFGNGGKMPRLKRFLAEVDPGLVPDTWWSGNDVGTADTAKRHLKSMFPALTPFETPKPEELAARIIHIATNPGDLVADLYAGSGTSAAVAQKMGRRWVTCEKESRTFDEFTHPRLLKVINGEDPGGVTSSFSAEARGQFAVFRNVDVSLRNDLARVTANTPPRKVPKQHVSKAVPPLQHSAHPV